VVERLRPLDDDEAVLAALAAPTRAQLNAASDALVVAEELAKVTGPPHGRASRARASRVQLLDARGRHLRLRAAGPGWLVIAESWDPGWKASVDAVPAPVLRVNHAQLAVPLAPGTHRVTLTHTPPGFALGCGLAAAALLGLLAAWAVDRRRRSRGG
jgi:hypothetical protein